MAATAAGVLLFSTVLLRLFRPQHRRLDED